jgi:hypothetical protein
MRGFNKRSERQALQASRTSRWLLGLGALAMAVIGLGLLVLMTQATGNRESYNQNYEWLALTNAIVASGLLATILWGAIRLLLRLKRGQFGGHFCLGGCDPRFVDLCGVLPIRVAVNRKLVRRQGGGSVGRWPQFGQGYVGYLEC